MKTASNLLFLVGFLFTPLSFSSTPEVKITSFDYTGARTRTAELCGEVENKQSSMQFVEVTSDPNWTQPGYYTTIVSENGKFCLTISTVTGKADAKLRGSGQFYSASIHQK